MWTMVKDIHRENGAWYITYNKGKGNRKVIRKSLIIEREIQNEEEKYEKNNRRNSQKVLFVTFRVATFLKIFNPTLCPNRQISHCY